MMKWIMLLYLSIKLSEVALCCSVGLCSSNHVTSWSPSAVTCGLDYHQISQKHTGHLVLICLKMKSSWLLVMFVASVMAQNGRRAVVTV